MRRASLGIILVLFAVVSCARIVYRHPEYTPQRWLQDSYECERDARQSGYFGGGIPGAIAMREFYDRCLAVRGWTKTRE